MISSYGFLPFLLANDFSVLPQLTLEHVIKILYIAVQEHFVDRTVIQYPRGRSIVKPCVGSRGRRGTTSPPETLYDHLECQCRGMGIALQERPHLKSVARA